MPYTSVRRLSKFRSKPKRRRTSTITKAKYKPKTTRANRSLIKNNAFAIRSIRRLMPKPVYCDWQLSGTLNADTQPSPNYSQNYEVIPLMSPVLWRACLRQSEVVPDKSMTRVLRMQLNLRYTMRESNWAQITTFIVTIRPDSADREITPVSLNIGNDYIDSFGQDMNPRLSPDLFKVHYTRNVTLTKNTFESAPVTSGGITAAFNPRNTYAKGQVTLKCNLNIRNPNRTAPWKDMEIDQFSPRERYYLLAFFTQQSDVAPGTVAGGARVDYDCLYTTMNSS